MKVYSVFNQSLFNKLCAFPYTCTKLPKTLIADRFLQSIYHILGLLHQTAFPVTIFFAQAALKLTKNAFLRCVRIRLETFTPGVAVMFGYYSSCLYQI